MLRRGAGCICIWDARQNGFVLPDLHALVPGAAHIFRALWSLFYNTSEVGKVVLRNMENKVPEEDRICFFCMKGKL